MFARYFVELAGDRDDIERVVLDAPQRWLPTLATSANHRGDRLLAEVGFGDDVRIARTVALTVGEPIRLADRTTIALDGRSYSLAIPAHSVATVRWGAQRGAR